MNPARPQVPAPVSVSGGRSLAGRLRLAATEAGTRWDLVLYALAGTMLVTTWRVQDLFPILATAQVPTLVAVAAYISFALTPDPRRRLKRIRHPITTLVLLTAIWALLSVPGGVYPGLSFKFLFKDHIKTLLMMVLIAGAVRTVQDVERFARVQVAGALVYSLYVLARVNVGSDGRLGDLFYYDANGLALLLAATLPLYVFYTRGQAVLTMRLLALAGCGISILTLMKSGSRGGFLALLASGLYLLFGFRAISKKVRWTAVGAMAALLVLVGSNQYWAMMGTLLHPTQDYNWSGKNEAGRMEVWKRGIGYMMSYPLFGVGANAFPIAEGTISPLAERQSVGIGLKWSAAHNSFVQIGAELGIPGLLIFLALLLTAFRTLHRIAVEARRRSGPQAREAALAQALIASLIAYCVAGFFLSEAFSPYLYSVLGMTVGLAKAVASSPLAAGGAVAPGRSGTSAGWRASRMMPPPSP